MCVCGSVSIQVHFYNIADELKIIFILKSESIENHIILNIDIILRFAKSCIVLFVHSVPKSFAKRVVHKHPATSPLA